MTLNYEDLRHFISIYASNIFHRDIASTHPWTPKGSGHRLEWSFSGLHFRCDQSFTAYVVAQSCARAKASLNSNLSLQKLSRGVTGLKILDKMAQSQQQYPPREFSPPQTTSSSHHSPFPGSNKRQRLSPNAQSPYNSPNMANIALPNQVFSSPYYGAQPNGSLSNSSQNATASIAQSGTMGPPSRPMDKPTDMNELSDVLLGSGVDLKEEEAALLGRHNFSSQQHQQQQQADTSFSSNLINSLNNDGSNHSTANTFMANNGFNVLAQNLPGDRSSFYGGGTFNQPATPFESAADRAEFERKKALRRKAERLQYHLNDPFLLTGWLQRRISQQAQKMQVIIPNAGLLSSTNYSGQVTEIAVAGPDNHEVLTLLKGQDLLYHDSPLVDLLTLVSLAAEERLRTLVEDAATLAKGRRLGSHGVVPDSLADLAVGDGAPESAHTLPTPSNSAISPKSNPLKRMLKLYRPWGKLYLSSFRLLCCNEQTSNPCLKWP